MTTKGYVYRFKDANEKILYIGKTNNIKTRMGIHFSSGHLKEQQYSMVSKVEYLQYPSMTDAGIMERYLISIYQPPFNTQYKNEGKCSIQIYEPNISQWNEYIDFRRTKTINRNKKHILLNRYLDRWYVGCDALYNNGFSLRIFKNNKVSKEIAWYQDDDNQYMILYNKYLTEECGKEPMLYFDSNKLQDQIHCAFKRDSVPMLCQGTCYIYYKEKYFVCDYDYDETEPMQKEVNRVFECLENAGLKTQKGTCLF